MRRFFQSIPLSRRDRHWHRAFVVLIFALLAATPLVVQSQIRPVANSSSGDGGGTSGCSLEITVSGPSPNPAKAGDTVIASLTATRNGPAVNSECAVTGKTCVWTVTSVRFRAEQSDSPTGVPTSVVNLAYDGVEPTAQFSASGLSAGYWEVSISAAATWTIEKSAGCGDCDCGGCKDATGATTIAFVVVAVDRIIVSKSAPEVSNATSGWVDDPITLEAMPKPAGAGFPPDTPKWTLDKSPMGSNVTVPGAASKTITITPDKPGEYKFTAKCGTSSASFTLTAYKLSIKYGGNDVTNQTTATIVGKKILLEATVEPVPPRMLVYEWTVPGTTVKKSTLDKKWPVRQELMNGDLDDAIIDFYWIAGGTNAVTVKVGPKAVTAKFEVKSPTAQFLSETTKIMPAIGFDGLDLRFGDPMNGPGISFFGRMQAPSGFSGDCAFLQLINTKQFTIDENGDKNGISSGGQFVLDDNQNRQDAFYDNVKPVNDMALATCSSADTPGGVLFPGWTNVSITDSFKTYFMFKPAGADSIWVTVMRMEWNWSVDRTKANGQWTLVNPKFAKDPKGVASSELPTWADIFAELEPGDFE